VAALRTGSAVLFAVSTAFPIAASLLPGDTPPRWLGVADVIVAFGVTALGVFLVSKYPHAAGGAAAERALAVLRGATTVFLCLLVLFFVAGDAIKWHVLLPGLAWRGWLFALVLPSWLALPSRG